MVLLWYNTHIQAKQLILEDRTMYHGFGYEKQHKIKVAITKEDIASRFRNEYLAKKKLSYNSQPYRIS